MKTSLLAVTAALALTLATTSTTFSQDAGETGPLTPEECLIKQGAGATPPAESLSSTSGDDSDSGDASDGPGAMDDERLPGCPDLEDDDDDN